MSDVLFGGFGSLAFNASPAADFITGAIIILEHQLVPEGSTYPLPEAVVDTLGNNQEGPVGEETSFDMRFQKVAAADVTTLRDAGFELTLYDAQFTSKDGRVVQVLRNLVLIVNHTPIPEYGKYGYVRIRGKAVSAGNTASHETTVSP